MQKSSGRVTPTGRVISVLCSAWHDTHCRASSLASVSALRGSVNFEIGCESSIAFSSLAWQEMHASWMPARPLNGSAWQAMHCNSIWWCAWLVLPGMNGCCSPGVCTAYAR